VVERWVVLRHAPIIAFVLEAWITIHDVALIEACEAEGRFAAIPHRYVFVGPRPVEGLPQDAEVIVARAWEPNVEQYPSFYDFTGWFVLGQMLDAGAIDGGHWLMIQYDHILRDPAAFPFVDDALADAGGPIAFVPGHRLAQNWMLLIPGFEEAFNAGMAVVGINPADFPDFNEWPSTQGTAWRARDLADFMRWFEPLFDFWAPNVWAGHLAERSVWAWMMSTGLPARYASGLAHEGRDCHGTCSLMAGNHDAYASRSLTFGR
jgi:hypothetical protein